ncbi:MAG TPA: hypothetical protein VJ813_02280 [Vicinamibacterales bacterium]|nr:hypothetical protein [Vicinamibacterales bacterium]
MKWFLWLIFVSLAVAAAALLLRDGGDTGSIASAAPLAAVTERNVRVKHELVTVTVPPSAPLDAPNHASARREPRRAGTVAEERPARREASLLEKAGRALVGDGTHRPEPFPRIRNF